MSIFSTDHYIQNCVHQMERIVQPRMHSLGAASYLVASKVNTIAIDSISDFADYAAKALKFILPKRIFSALSRYTVQIHHSIDPDGYHYWDQITKYTFLGAMPLDNYAHAKSITTLGIRAVVAITEDHELLYAPWSDPVQASLWKKHKVDFLQIPSSDLDPLSYEHIAQAVDFIAEHVKSKHKVYIHCNAGRGRSAIIATSYLCAKLALSLDDALTHVRQCRPQILPSDYQIAAVQEYLDQLSTS